ncbi:MAG: S8 family serine peptidase [Candidatus Thermoplasmatota archaeon]|nr:S8 family serine peptidase [Candidatus Thermoplasmatota archaeon]
MNTVNRSMLALVLAVLVIGQVNLASSAFDERSPDQPVFTGSSGEFPVFTHWGAFPLKDLRENIPRIGDESAGTKRIIQFDGPIPSELHRELNSIGVEVLGYLPEYSFIVDTRDADISALISMEGFSGMSTYPSGLKIMPEVYDLFRDDSRRWEVQGARSLVVDLFREDPTIFEELEDVGTWTEQASSTRYLVGLPISSLGDLLGIESVEWVEPRYEMVLYNDVASGIMGVPEIWNTHGLTGAGQIVAIADTGIDTGVDSHSTNGDMIADLDNRVTPVFWAGYSAIDTHSHGTHVAGSVAGNGSLSNGTIRGMAPEAEVFFQAISNESAGNSLQIPANTSLIFKQAYDNGARIHTNSWGSSVYGQYTTRSWDVDWFLYNYPDMIILYSAGNSGMDYYKPWGTYNPDGKIDDDSIGAPASAKSCITVGASENNRSTGGFQGTWNSGWGWPFTLDPVRSDGPSDDPDGLAAFSSRGPTDDGRQKPEIVAPGTNILSLRSTQTPNTGWGTYAGNSNYIFMGGTSMSTPLTAGTVVLIRQYYNSTLGYDTPSGALMKATLINGGVDLTPGQYGSSNATTQEINGRPDNHQGWGRVNLTESLYPGNGNLAFIDNMSGISTGEKVASTLSVASSSKELRLTLAWSDHPPSMAASKQLVNDLDLWVEAPNGTIYNGNDLIAPFNDTKDDTNPVEGIMISSPSAGIWKVFINGTNIPMGPQHFALVASGDISNFSGVVEVDMEYYSTEGDTINIQVFDQDLIGDGTVVVNVSSDSFQAGRAVTLTESGSSGLFTGSIITINASTSNTSFIHVSHDDTITVWYQDSDPSGLFTASAIAKDPVRLSIKWKEEFSLVQAFNETIHLEGNMDRNITGWWKLNGIDSGWRPLHDDGNSTYGDTVSDDGNYSDIWSVPSDTNGLATLVTAIEDPYLGNRTYTHFDMTFNSSVPRYPKNLSISISPEGNSVTLDWSDTDETDILHYGIYVNSSSTMSSWAPSGWSHLMNTSSTTTQTVVGGLIDGINYGFRVSAYDLAGNESSTSTAIYATPGDTEPPLVNIITIAHTIVGTAHLEFVGSADLEMVELQFSNDSNDNGLMDDDNWEAAGIGYPSNFTWDTRNSSGGPGNINRMFLRYRGYDEVPNISDWVSAFGFRIDNTGPSDVELTVSPQRITNIVYHTLEGRSEGDGYVLIFLNGIEVDNATCDPLGGFSFDMDMDEGPNELNLSAYDQYGAGPTNRSYNFTLDTRAPVASIDVEDQSKITREIRPEGYMLNSSSYDRGIDPLFTYVENITWTYRGPDEVAKVFYKDGSIHLSLDDLGIHLLTIDVRDPAGNVNSTTLSIEILDTTTPMLSINGPLLVDEKKPISYTVNITDNDPKMHLRKLFRIHWNATGTGDFNYEFENDPFIVWFPGPGSFNISLEVRDGGNNTNMTFVIVEVSDTTPPNLGILGASEVLLGVPETYTANVTDNDEHFPDGATFSWNLSYLEGPPSGWWSKSFEGVSFTYNYTENGAYTLILEVTDASGNGRELQINIEADGDLTPPMVREILPAVNSSYQFSETVLFTVRFNELMNRSSLTTDTVQLIDQNGDPVNITLEIKNRQGVTEVKIDHGPLEFEGTYAVQVTTGVKDAWENNMAEEFRANFTIRTQFELVYPWGYLDEVFTNFSRNRSIRLVFSNPVESGSLINYMNLKALTWGVDVLGNERLSLISVPFILEQGDTELEIILKADWDEGVEYNITIFNGALDVFGYEMDRTYTWEFKIYIPPAAQPGGEEEKEDDPLPNWMNNPVYWIMIAAAILFVILLVIIFGMVRRRRNLKKIWAAGEEDPGREIYSPPPPVEVVGEGPVEETPKEEPAPMTYDDLYGSSGSASREPDRSAPEEVGSVTSFMEPPPPVPSYSPPAPPVEPGASTGLEWDEDDSDEEWDDPDGSEDDDELEW